MAMTEGLPFKYTVIYCCFWYNDIYLQLTFPSQWAILDLSLAGMTPQKVKNRFF